MVSKWTSYSQNFNVGPPPTKRIRGTGTRSPLEYQSLTFRVLRDHQASVLRRTICRWAVLPHPPPPHRRVDAPRSPLPNRQAHHQLENIRYFHHCSN